MRIKHFHFLITIFFISSCSRQYHPQILIVPFSEHSSPTPPDYSIRENWAALPDKVDNADKVPADLHLNDEQINAETDVFFIHPTLYLKTTDKSNQWNADVTDTIVNKRVDESTILYQASVFNGAGKIYAPRYRQAHISAYYSSNKDDNEKSLALAYSDVSNAFKYYLDHYNNGRPIIIASHSQGTTHANRLIKDFFEGKPLMKQLVCAYLIGMPVYDSTFTILKPCSNAGENGCFVTWRTYARNYFPKGYSKPPHETVCTNPLIWTTDSVYASRDMNKGGILKNFNHVIPRLTDARVLNGVLRIHKPHFPGKIFVNFKNYHIVDYNLFYLNIRENAQQRVKKFLKR